MTQLRKVVFLIFAAIYLVAAPLTILYALGYIFNPVRQALQPTGLVSLVSEPAEAEISLDGLRIKEKTPFVVRNLTPGVHQIEVHLGGGHPWRKRVNIRPEIALRFEDILLFPLSSPPEIFGRFSPSRIWRVPDRERLLVLEGEQASGLYLFDTERKTFRPILRATPYDDAKIREIIFHRDGDQALAILEKKEALTPLLIELTDPVKITSLSGMVQDSFENLQWDATDKDSLFYLKGDFLGRLDLKRGFLYPAVAKQVRGYALHEGRLFVLDQRKYFLELNQKGKTEEILLDDPVKARLVFGEREARYAIHFLPHISVFFSAKEAVAVFLSEERKLFTNRLPYFLDEGVDEIALAHSHRRLAYRKGEELWVVDFEREKEKSFFESGAAPRRIYSGSETLSSLSWFYNDQYLLFREGNRLMVMDFEGEEAVELLKTSDRFREIALDPHGGFLYFVHPKRDRLCRIRLFERRR